MIMLRILTTLFALVALSACATTEAPQATSIEAIQAARMADLLTQTAQTAPDRVRAAQSELAALERVLMTPSVATGPSDTSLATAPLAAAPDLTGASSLMSAVHLASYREYGNLVSGWDELRGGTEALAGLQPRISQVDLGERGIFLRLKAGPLDSADQALALCAELEAAGHWCRPADHTGAVLEPLAD